MNVKHIGQHLAHSKQLNVNYYYLGRSTELGT